MKRIRNLFTMAYFIITITIISMTAEASVRETEITTTGITISTLEFQQYFSDLPSKRPSMKSMQKQNTEIVISDIIIIKDKINFNMLLTGDEISIKVPVEGKLTSGYKTQNGMNSIIIEVAEPILGYEFLLFEVYNDVNGRNMLVVDESVAKKPHIKIYLKDQNDCMYLFEQAMPSIFAGLNANSYQEANKYKDALWAINFVKHNVKKVPVDNSILQQLGIEISSKALGSLTTWTNPYMFVDEFYVGLDAASCTSLPYVEYKHTNVTQADSTWMAYFKVAEHMNVAGNTYYGNNVFEYRNLRMAFACGDNSIFIRSFQNGKLKHYVNLSIFQQGQNIAVQLLNKVFNSLPHGATLQTVLGYLNSLSSSAGTVCLGSEGVTIHSGKATAIGEQLNSEYILTKNFNSGGEYFLYQAVLHSEGSGSGNTVGALRVSFTVYNSGDYSEVPISKDFQLNYTVQ